MRSKKLKTGLVAQRLEQFPLKEKADGSNPSGLTVFEEAVPLFIFMISMGTLVLGVLVLKLIAK